MKKEIDDLNVKESKSKIKNLIQQKKKQSLIIFLFLLIVSA